MSDVVYVSTYVHARVLVIMAARPEWLPFLFICLATLAEVNSQPRPDPAPTPDPSRDMHPASSGSTVTSGT